VTAEHNEECKRLLRLMGVPVVDAPCEAEAQCAELVKAGAVYAAATEDMDSLTFGTPRVVRNLMAPASAKKDPTEYDLAVALRDLGLTHAQFVDVCILCGCDYAGTLKGVGPTRALALIKELGSIEAVLAVKDGDGNPKYPAPDPFPYETARQLFLHPTVTPAAAVEPQPKWTAADVDGVVADKGFAEDRVRKALGRVAASAHKATQGRLESFFGPAKTVSSTLGPKRPAPGAKGKGVAGGVKKPKGKAGGVSRKK